MFLWRINPLAKELAAEQISEQQGMAYFLASTLLILVQTQYAMWWGARSGWLFFVEFLILALIAIVGCICCWKANGSDNGTNFVLRAICLSVPAGIRVFVFSLFFGQLLYNTAEQIFDPTSFANPVWAYEVASYAGFIGFSIYFWYLLYQGLSLVSKYPAQR